MPFSKDDRAWIEGQVRQFYDRADAWLARDLGVDRRNVSYARGRLEARGEIPILADLRDAGGVLHRRKVRMPDGKPSPFLIGLLNRIAEARGPGPAGARRAAARALLTGAGFAPADVDRLSLLIVPEDSDPPDGG